MYDLFVKGYRSRILVYTWRNEHNVNSHLVVEETCATPSTGILSRFVSQGAYLKSLGV